MTGTTGVSAATANSHILQIMAGAPLNVYVRWIKVYQVGLATVAAIDVLQLLRLTTAGTGGGVLTPAARDSADAASGAAGMTLPTVKGTEGTTVDLASCLFIQTAPTGGPGGAPLLCTFDFSSLRGKALRIPAGAANGIALKNPTARAGATVLVVAEIMETNV